MARSTTYLNVSSRRGVEPRAVPFVNPIWYTLAPCLPSYHGIIAQWIRFSLFFFLSLSLSLTHSSSSYALASPFFFPTLLSSYSFASYYTLPFSSSMCRCSSFGPSVHDEVVVLKSTASYILFPVQYIPSILRHSGHALLVMTA